MKQRILTAVIFLPLVVIVLLFSHTVVLPIAVSIFAAIGVFEMLGCIGTLKYPSVTVPSILLTAVLVFVTRYSVSAAERSSYVMAIFTSVLFVYMFYLMCLSVISKGEKKIGDMALTAMMVFYIIIGFASMVVLRDVRSDERDVGAWLFALVLVGAWIPDSAAYFVGKAFGRHKLIPDVSPKKTVEGAVGGVVFGAISFVVCGLIAKATLGFEPHYLSLAIAGLVVAIVSIFGDLIASLVKRQYGIKDYGKLFPGHGGVMDRFDSIIAIAPFLMIATSHPDIFSLII